MKTHLEISQLDPENYEVKAVQGHVVTLHTIGVHPELRHRLGLGPLAGTTVVHEVVEILLEHEALAAVPSDSRLEQLFSTYPYLASELQQRLSTGSVEFPLVEPPRVDFLPAEDRPTHT